MNVAEPRRPYLTNVKYLSFAKNVIGNRHPQHPFCCPRFSFERAGVFFRAPLCQSDQCDGNPIRGLSPTIPFDSFSNCYA